MLITVEVLALRSSNCKMIDLYSKYLENKTTGSYKNTRNLQIKCYSELWVYAMNRDIHYWVHFSLYHSFSLRAETKSVKEDRLRTIVSTWREQRITIVASFSLLQRNKDFQTPLEQANKMADEILPPDPFFIKKIVF